MPSKLHRDDLLNATLTWVQGKVFETLLPNNLYAGQFRDGDGKLDLDAVHRFALRVHNTVWKYLHGQKTLDGSCSDFECTLSHQAQYVFSMHLDVSTYDLDAVSTALGWSLTKTRYVLQTKDAKLPDIKFESGAALGQFIRDRWADRDNPEY